MLARLGRGRPLDRDVRSRMEPLFGRDFARVRVHADAQAEALAAGLDARAFTIGEHVVLGSAEGRPGTNGGDATLAHELAHVVQQAHASPSAVPLRDGSPAYDALEREADSAASAVVAKLWSGSPAVVAGRLASAPSGRGIQRAPKPGSGPAKPRKPSLPPFRIQSDDLTAGHGWLFEFDEWVTRSELVEVLFRAGDVPTGFTVEPTRPHDKGDFLSLHWAVRWEGGLRQRLGELTDYGVQLVWRVLNSPRGGGEEFTEDTSARRAAEEGARKAKHEHDQTFVPALGMTGEQALRTLKPGIYVTAPGRPLRPVPHLEWRDKRPDVGWIRGYLPDGVFVWVNPATIEIRELGHPADETFWADLIWFMQRGYSLSGAEKAYIELMEELIRMMIAAMAQAYATAPAIGPRANVVEETLTIGAGRAASKDVGMLGRVDPLEAAQVGLTGVGVAIQDYYVIKDAIERSEAEAGLDEAQAAYERGDLYQLPVFVAEDAAIQDVGIQRAPAGTGSPKQGAKRSLSIRERVDGFVNDVAIDYRNEITAASKKFPKRPREG